LLGVAGLAAAGASWLAFVVVRRELGK
jgi:hypothetical protein